MLASSVLVTLAGLVSFSTAGYVLEDDYSVDQFFSMFDFFTVRKRSVILCERTIVGLTQ